MRKKSRRGCDVIEVIVSYNRTTSSQWLRKRRRHHTNGIPNITQRETSTVSAFCRATTFYLISQLNYFDKKNVLISLPLARFHLKAFYVSLEGNDNIELSAKRPLIHLAFHFPLWFNNVQRSLKQFLQITSGILSSSCRAYFLSEECQWASSYRLTFSNVISKRVVRRIPSQNQHLLQHWTSENEAACCFFAIVATFISYSAENEDAC